MRPDLYDGDECDQVKPQWYSEMDGDMCPEEGLEVIDYAAIVFPPGTKITISVPCCPKCGTPSENISDCGGFIGGSACDFDWKNWMNEKYS